MRLLKAGMLYFALVFGAGFLLGTVRVLWIVPRFGARSAELMEAPIMLAVTILSARWIVRSFYLPPKPVMRLGTGFLALGFLLIAEFILALWLRGLTIREYIASRNPVSGTVYVLLLALFAIMPLLIIRR